jgi:GNAT superfamily N-acetyltransferase
VIPIRPARDSDRNYIVKSWVRSMSGQFPYSRMSAKGVNKYAKRVSALLDTGVTVVACDPENDDVVYGFACGESGEYLGVESPTLHFVWVRKPFRRNGIGTSLVRTIFPAGEPLIYTHITKDIHHANLEEAWNLVEFDPYYIEGALYSRARLLDAAALPGITSPCAGGASV